MIWLLWLMGALQQFETEAAVPALPAAAALEQVALRKLGFEDWHYEEAGTRLRARHWLPAITVRMSASSWDRASVSDDVATLDLRRSGFSGEVSATWHLSGLVFDDHEVALAREHIQVQRAINETVARVRSDMRAYRALEDDVRAGNTTARAELLNLRQSLLGGRPHAP